MSPLSFLSVLNCSHTIPHISDTLISSLVICEGLITTNESPTPIRVSSALSRLWALYSSLSYFSMYCFVTKSI